MHHSIASLPFLNLLFNLALSQSPPLEILPVMQPFLPPADSIIAIPQHQSTSTSSSISVISPPPLTPSSSSSTSSTSSTSIISPSSLTSSSITTSSLFIISLPPLTPSTSSITTPEETSTTTLTTSARFNNSTITMTSRTTTRLDPTTRTGDRTRGSGTTTATPIIANDAGAVRVSLVSLALVCVVGFLAFA